MNSTKVNNKLSYLGGLFEAEGSSIISRQINLNNRHDYRYNCELKIEMTDIEPLNLAFDTFGGSLKNAKVRNEHHSKSFIWRISGRQTIPVAKELLKTMLIPRKRNALNNVIDFADTIRINSSPLILNSNIIVKREELFQQNRVFNKRGNGAKHDYKVIVNTSPQLFLFGLPDKSKSYEIKSMITEEASLDYLAGMFDGDGSAIIHRAKDNRGYSSRFRYICSLSLQLTDIEPVVAFYNCFKGRVFTRPGYDNHRECFVWVLENRQACEIAKMLIPHLVISRKHKVLERIIEFGTTYSINNRICSNEMQKRERLYHECRVYNTKGQNVNNRSKIALREIENHEIGTSQLTLW